MSVALSCDFFLYLFLLFFSFNLFLDSFFYLFFAFLNGGHLITLQAESFPGDRFAV